MASLPEAAASPLEADPPQDMSRDMTATADPVGEMDEEFANWTAALDAQATAPEAHEVDGFSFVSSSSAAVETAPADAPAAPVITAEMCDRALVALGTHSTLEEVSAQVHLLYPELGADPQAIQEGVKKVVRSSSNSHRFVSQTGTRNRVATTVYSLMGGSSKITGGDDSDAAKPTRERRPVGSTPKPAAPMRHPLLSIYDTTLCSLCGTGENEGQLLLCDRCDCGFHMVGRLPSFISLHFLVLPHPPREVLTSLCCIVLRRSPAGEHSAGAVVLPILPRTRSRARAPCQRVSRISGTATGT
jgi:hypothetical protein